MIKRSEKFIRAIEFNLAVINQWLERKPDRIFFSDDWGSQKALLVDPNDWQKLYKHPIRECRNDVHALIKLFGSFNGGYIGGTSHLIMPETPLDNVIALYEAFLEYH